MSKCRASGQEGVLCPQPMGQEPARRRMEGAAHSASVSLARALFQLCWEAGKYLSSAEHRVLLGRQIEKSGCRGQLVVPTIGDSIPYPCSLYELGDSGETKS